MIGNTQNIVYYDAAGISQIECSYDYSTGFLTFPPSFSAEISKIRVNWAGARRCVEGIYDMDSPYGMGLTVISAFLPETFAAVVAGCIAKNTSNY